MEGTIQSEMKIKDVLRSHLVYPDPYEPNYFAFFNFLGSLAVNQGKRAQIKGVCGFQQALPADEWILQ